MRYLMAATFDATTMESHQTRQGKGQVHTREGRYLHLAYGELFLPRMLVGDILDVGVTFLVCISAMSPRTRILDLLGLL